MLKEPGIFLILFSITLILLAAPIFVRDVTNLNQITSNSKMPDWLKDSFQQQVNFGIFFLILLTVILCLGSYMIVLDYIEFKDVSIVKG